MQNRADILEAASAYRLSRVLLTAMELDLFTQIEDSSRSPSEIAGLIGADPRAIDRLCAVLCGAGLLDRQDGRYGNTPLARRHLVRGSDEYLGGLMHSAHLWTRWTELTAAVRLGQAPAAEEISDRGGEWLEAFIAAMHSRGLSQAPLDIGLLDLQDTSHVLDLGGGSGVFAMAFVQIRPDMRATVFDLPEVVGITRRYIEEAELTPRIGTLAGDYRTDDIGSGYDLVFLSAIVHSNSSSVNATLLRRCADALNPGGQVVVQDFVIDEDRVHPAGAALFALNMLVATSEGDTFTESEIREWMEAAGLVDVVRQDTLTGTAQVIGRKPKP